MSKGQVRTPSPKGGARREGSRMTSWGARGELSLEYTLHGFTFCASPSLSVPAVSSAGQAGGGQLSTQGGADHRGRSASGRPCLQVREQRRLLRRTGRAAEVVSHDGEPRGSERAQHHVEDSLV